MAEKSMEEKQVTLDSETTTNSNFDSFSEDISVELLGLKGVIQFNKEPIRKQSLDKKQQLSSFSTDTGVQLKIEARSRSNSECNSNSSSDDSSIDGNDFPIKIIDFPEDKLLNEEKEEKKEKDLEKDITDDLTKSFKHVTFSQETKKEKKKNKLSKAITYEGYIFKYNTEDETRKLIWLVLLDQNIYYYSDEKKEEFTGFHHISGCFVKENGKAVINNETYYSFSIIFSNKTRTFYSKDKNNSQEWSKQIRQSIGYQNFFDFYQIVGDIGKGSFGVVKLGRNSITKDKVAIKIIDKKKLNSKELEQVQREIAIMKSIKHPNTISLIDHFENSEYFFIIMEYIKYGSLKEFVKANKKLSEEVCANIIFQITSGLKYLNEFGIIHRDLKPDNILIDLGDYDIQVKIADFGLSKIISPEEKATEGFGTIIFMAPEVLLKKPYNNSVDIWSLGVMTYYLMTRTYPFFDEKLNQKVIAGKIIHRTVMFPEPKWKSMSNEIKDFITSCLEKDCKKRINIDQILSNKWILKRIYTEK